MDDANLYHRSNKLQMHDASWAMQAFFPTLSWENDSYSLLDIGCGTGDLTKNVLMESLPMRPSKVVGIDSSDEMVEYASKYYSDDTTSFYQMSALDKNMAQQLFSQQFDKITSFYCLHWITDQKTALEVMFDLLVEGGQVLLVFLASNPLFDSYEALSRDNKWSQYMNDVSSFIPPQHYKKKPAEEFKDISEEVGFHVNVCEAVQRTFAFPNITLLRNSIAAVNPFLKRIPSHLQNDFLTDLVQDLSSRCQKVENTNNPCAQYKLMTVTLTKPSCPNINLI